MEPIIFARTLVTGTVLGGAYSMARRGCGAKKLRTFLGVK